MTDYAKLLQALHEAEAEFLVIDGLAAMAHGSPRFTQDVDVLYRRSRENYARLTSALALYQPRLRGAPLGLPFRWDDETIRRGLNFTLTAEIGDIDFLGEVAGGGTYEQLIENATTTALFEIPCACLNLTQLIATKRAAGRPKDLEVIAELEALLETGEEIS